VRKKEEAADRLTDKTLEKEDMIGTDMIDMQMIDDWK